jgi:hypothetical protein
MFKRLIFSVSIIKAIALLLFFIASLQNVKGQFLHAYGATVGFTLANQTWNFDDAETRFSMRNRFGLNGSLFLEFFNHDVFTWVMEGQFNQLGARWVVSPDNRNVDYKHRLNYLSFNNFLKARTEGIDANLYVLAGPRVMYQLSSNAPDFRQLSFAVSGGIGMDYTYLDPVIFFVETQYIYGIFSAAENVAVRNRAFEFKIGIKKLFGGSSDYCPPVLL